MWRQEVMERNMKEGREEETENKKIDGMRKKQTTERRKRENGRGRKVEDSVK